MTFLRTNVEIRWRYAKILVAAVLCLTAATGLTKNTPYAYTAGTIVAIGDIHGAYDSLTQLLIANQLVNRQLQWAAGTTHLVSLGDFLDRGPKSKQVMDLLIRLQLEAEAAGGKVHVLLGNHEAMNLTGDLTNVSDAEYQAFANATVDTESIAPSATKPLGFYQHRAAFSKDGYYGRWLLTLPSVITINDTVFTHGGLSPLVGKLGLVQTNHAVTAALAAHLASEAISEPLPPILDDPGPLWYRGTAVCHELIEASVLENALDELGVERVVIGHTPTPNRRVAQRFDGRVLAIDTGMLNAVYKGQAFALELTAGQVSVLDAQGRRTNQIESYRDIGKNLGSYTEMALAEQLALADAASDSANPGVFGFQDLLGQTHTAKFVNTSQKNAKAAEALWRLDRLLGVQMVPLTLARKLNNRWGYLDFSLGRWVTETERQSDRLSRPNYCLEYNDYQIQAAFDLLTRKMLRRPQALSYQAGTWALRLTDQHMSFPRTTSLIRLPQAPKVPQRLLVRLENLTATNLQANIGQLIGAREINSVLKRRDKLLALIAKESP